MFRSTEAVLKFIYFFGWQKGRNASVMHILKILRKISCSFFLKIVQLNYKTPKFDNSQAKTVYGTVYSSHKFNPNKKRENFRYKLKPSRKPQTVLLLAKEVSVPMLCVSFCLIFTRTPGKREDGRGVENVFE